MLMKLNAEHLPEGEEKNEDSQEKSGEKVSQFKEKYENRRM